MEPFVDAVSAAAADAVSPAVRHAAAAMPDLQRRLQKSATDPSTRTKRGLSQACLWQVGVCFEMSVSRNARA